MKRCGRRATTGEALRRRDRQLAGARKSAGSQAGRSGEELNVRLIAEHLLRANNMDATPENIEAVSHMPKIVAAPKKLRLPRPGLRSVRKQHPTEGEEGSLPR